MLSWHSRMSCRRARAAAEREFSLARLRAGGELALFVKLAVVGQVGFRYQRQQLAAADGGGAVIELAAVPHRQAQYHQRISAGRGLADLLQRLQRAPQQGIGAKEVAAGVARQTQLRQHQHIGPGLVRLPDAFHGLGRVGLRIGQRRGHGPGRDLNKTVLHLNTLSFAKK
jgi:hypothetical protein